MDFPDAERLVKRLVTQELTLSFVPDTEQRLWRTVMRRRDQITRNRVQLHNRLEALLAGWTQRQSQTNLNGLTRSTGSVRQSSSAPDAPVKQACSMTWATGCRGASQLLDYADLTGVARRTGRFPQLVDP